MYRWKLSVTQTFFSPFPLNVLSFLQCHQAKNTQLKKFS